MGNFGLSAGEFGAIVSQMAGTQARCLNPDCSVRMSYRATDKGRQSLYCGDACRRQTWRVRARLAKQLRSVTESLDMVKRPAPAAALLSAQAHLRWLLARYPGANDGDDQDDALAEQPPLGVALARLDDHWTPEALEDASRYDARMRIKYMERRRRPLPLTPTLSEQQRAVAARRERLLLELELRATET